MPSELQYFDCVNPAKKYTTRKDFMEENHARMETNYTDTGD